MNAIFISATHKSSGKTTVTLGLAAALARRGLVVQPFKKGPDYIDPIWLGLAAGRPCRNLDFHTMSRDEIVGHFVRHGAEADLCLVEGNKGLFDGLDVAGSDSNAALAELLGVPVVLVIDTRGVTRGVAPLVRGYQAFGENLKIAGVILNQVGGPRHEGKLRAALERYTDVPVIGAIGRYRDIGIEERHLGLVPANEEEGAGAKIDEAARIVGESVDLERLGAFACGAEGHAMPLTAAVPLVVTDTPVRIAIARDAAFGFYYPDDLEALERAGARLVPFDAIRDSAFPDVDGLFIGGGFPETQAEKLSQNSSLRHSIRAALDNGLPAYAECGGMMYLARSLTWCDRQYEMVGFVPGNAVMHERPVGRGYVKLRETGTNPWPLLPETSPASEISVHEFHYASMENLPSGLPYAYEVLRGHGIDGRNDGLVIGNLLAGFSHQRNVPANPWAERFVRFVRSRKQEHASVIPSSVEAYRRKR